jgi:hypothetical protein
MIAMALSAMAGAALAQSMPSGASTQAASDAPAAMVRKPCEDLKAEIDAKIKKNGVPMFTLEVVDIDAQAEGKSVGTCDGNTKKIVYKRG